MKKLISVMALVTSIAACSKGKDPKDACEAIYQKGDGSKPYTGDKTKFMDVCMKAGDDTRRCLQLSGEESFKDDSCGPGHGSTFKESMEIMQLGQGGK
jgi:hypothetical protein